MTREQFENEIVSFDDLIRICDDYDIDDVEDILSYDAMNDYVYNNLAEYAYNNSWEDLRDALADISPNYDWYRINGLNDIVGLDDDDFEYYKSDVYQTFEVNEFFDEDNDEEPEEEPYIPPAAQDNSFKEAPITFTELFQSAEDIQAKHSDSSQPELDALLDIQEAV